MPGMLKRFGSAGKDLLEEFYKKSPKQRLADASERATWDPADGGLGLAPGNTSYERMQLMFPTRVFHGGRGKAVQAEVPITSMSGNGRLGQRHAPDMWASDHPKVGSTYAPGARRDRKPQTEGLSPNEIPSFMETFYQQQRQQEVPDFSGNVMPIRINADDAAVIDFENRYFSGEDSNLSPEGWLNDTMVRDTKGTDLLRFRYELGEDGIPKRVAYLPHETPVGETVDYKSFGTDMLHQVTGNAMLKQYGITPPITRFDNIIDIGKQRHGETFSERFIPSTVYAIRDGSKIRSDFAAFDPLLRKYSGLSLGTSAAAVGSLLEQLPADEDKGALYQ